MKLAILLPHLNKTLLNLFCYILILHTVSCLAVGCCSGFLSVAVIKHSDQKKLRGGRGLFGLYFPFPVHHLGKSEQTLKQELAGSHHGGALFAALLRLYLS